MGKEGKGDFQSENTSDKKDRPAWGEEGESSLPRRSLGRIVSYTAAAVAIYKVWYWPPIV